MKIRCPQCQRITEIPHVDHGRIAVCACRATFRIDESTIMEELSLPDLPPPETIGRYQIVRYLGRGATNCVYEGIHPDLGIHVAVKTLLPEYAADKPSRDRFLHAAKIYAKAVHPNIVKVYETGKDANGVPFLSMEFLSGGSLADSMQENGFFTAKETARIGVEVCRALVVTAGLGIVHRDIKPDNIMLSADGQYKLTDLGLAKLDPSSAPGNISLVPDENEPGKTARKTSFGTLEYMSPEQYIDTESCDARSDIYSLGVTMYQLAAGRLPFETQTRSELRHMHISVEPLVPSSYVHGIPIDFDYIVMHCIQKRPEDRYNTPEELLADLEAFLADAPLPSTTSGAVPLNTGTMRAGGTDGQQSGSSLLRTFFTSLIYHPLTIVVLMLGIAVLAGAYLYRLMGSRSAKKLQEQLSIPDETAGSAQDSSVFPLHPSSTEPVTTHGRQSNQALIPDDYSIDEEQLNTQASGLFEEARKNAEQALKEKTGLNMAIEALESFELPPTSEEKPIEISYEDKEEKERKRTPEQERSDEAKKLISELERVRTEEVKKLMDDLNEKADQFIKAGNVMGAVSVYKDDKKIANLKKESEKERMEKIEEIRRNTENESDPTESAATGSAVNLTEEASRP